MTRSHSCILALGLLCLGGCEIDNDPVLVEVHLGFTAKVGSNEVACGETLSAIGTPQTDVQLQDLRFYVSELALIGPDGEVPLALTTDGTWIAEDVALIDLEDGTGACSATGNPQMNDTVSGKVPEGDYTGVAFTLGVPFELNHNDVSAAPPPLDVPSLFWVWQTGYKFMRLDLQNGNEAPADDWFVHMGSIGCTSAASTAAPSVECSRPNRARIVLEDFDLTTDVIALDIGALLSGADVGTNTENTPPGCMSNVDDTPECAPLYGALGMDWVTGTCVGDCGTQTAFSAWTAP